MIEVTIGDNILIGANTDVTWDIIS